MSPFKLRINPTHAQFVRIKAENVREDEGNVLAKGAFKQDLSLRLRIRIKTI